MAILNDYGGGHMHFDNQVSRWWWQFSSEYSNWAEKKMYMLCGGITLTPFLAKSLSIYRQNVPLDARHVDFIRLCEASTRRCPSVASYVGGQLILLTRNWHFDRNVTSIIPKDTDINLTKRSVHETGISSSRTTSVKPALERYSSVDVNASDPIIPNAPPPHAP